MSELIPETVVECGGCGDDLNLLRTHLAVQIKAERHALVAPPPRDPFAEDDKDNPPIALGTQSGRGRIVHFHNFNCISKYGTDRKDNPIKIEPHKETDIYEPKDNRSPEELVKAGELPEAMLLLHKALAEEVEA